MQRFWTTLLHATASHLSNMSSKQKNGDLYQSEVERQSGGQRTDKTNSFRTEGGKNQRYYAGIARRSSPGSENPPPITECKLHTLTG